MNALPSAAPHDGGAPRGKRLAGDVLEGLPAEGVHEQLEALKGSSLVWQFQVSCLRYCSFVHLHHHVEDIDFFGELEGINPVDAAARGDYDAIGDCFTETPRSGTRA